MNNLRVAEVIRQSGSSFTPQATRESHPEPLEVNVIFTDLGTTAVALRAAESLAHGLGACIRLRAGIAVSRGLPLDRPQVSTEFFRELLCRLVAQPELDGLQISIHLYICRDWTRTLRQVLKPNSLVVLGGRERWWPTGATRLAKMLQTEGHRVTLVHGDSQSPVKHSQMAR